MAKIILGSWNDSIRLASMKAYMTEFLSTFLFVFATVGSAMAYGKLTLSSPIDPSGVVAVALCHAFALSVAVAAASGTSGGHVNPAVTLALTLGGHCTVLTCGFYWVAQLLGAIFASLFLRLATGSHHLPIHHLAPGVSLGRGFVTEVITTFALVYTVYMTAVNTRKGAVGTIAPIMIGFVVAANVLFSGPYTGASMNPARSFGPAVASGHFHHQWLYWVGPLFGGGLAGVICEGVLEDDISSVKRSDGSSGNDNKEGVA